MILQFKQKMMKFCHFLVNNFEKLNLIKKMRKLNKGALKKGEFIIRLVQCMIEG